MFKYLNQVLDNSKGLITSEFAVKRTIVKPNRTYVYFHAGKDRKGTKKTLIYSCLPGKVHKQFFDPNYGKNLIIRTNLKHFLGPDESIFLKYAHLSNITTAFKEGSFFPEGYVIGLMGNTGKCMTNFNKKGVWTKKTRFLEPDEIKNTDCNYGVHLHFDISQEANPGQETEFLKDLFRMSLASKKTEGETHFYQTYGTPKLYISPDVLKEYLLLKCKSTARHI